MAIEIKLMVQTSDNEDKFKNNYDDSVKDTYMLIENYNTEDVVLNIGDNLYIKVDKEELKKVIKFLEL